MQRGHRCVESGVARGSHCHLAFLAPSSHSGSPRTTLALLHQAPEIDHPQIPAGRACADPRSPRDTLGSSDTSSPHLAEATDKGEAYPGMLPARKGRSKARRSIPLTQIESSELILRRCIETRLPRTFRAPLHRERQSGRKRGLACIRQSASIHSETVRHRGRRFLGTAPVQPVALPTRL